MAEYSIEPLTDVSGGKQQWNVQKIVSGQTVKTYKVTHTVNGFWQCSCPAGIFHHDCKHIKMCGALVAA